MKRDIKNAMWLYLVTDRRWLRDRKLIDDVELALKGGVTCVQLRDKELSRSEWIEEALAMKELCHQYQVPLIINDNVEVMLEADADGVHVGQNDMPAAKVRELIGPNKILGVSAHNKEEALLAIKAGADYLGVGAIFTTSTKDDAKVINLQDVSDICKSVDIPIVAIGGIHENNIDQLIGTGVSGVAVVSAIMAKDDILEASKELKRKVQNI